MARSTTIYQCTSCTYSANKWLGRCPQCEAWGSLEEQTTAPSKPLSTGAKVKPATTSPIHAVEEDGSLRFSSGSVLVDRVLGGGVVAGGAVLVAGEPGIGKSTLLLQIGDAMAAEGSVLYVSAEESPRQLRLRSERLGCSESAMHVTGEAALEPVLAAVEAKPPRTLIIDSIQAMRSTELNAAAGSVAQVRWCADRLVSLCKVRGVALFLVGHVTKEGGIAGPKSLEHLLDTVITFEGEGATGYRLLRAHKNRFGATGEIAMFEMFESGLEPVADPSRVLLERRREHRPGSAVLASLHGSRPLLVEVQALVNPSHLPTPRRMTVGLEGTRTTLLVAVLERFGRLALSEYDLFLNLAGGLAVREPAADLAVAAAILSAVSDRALPSDTAYFGEIGLLGESRGVARTELRLREIAHMGFRRVVCPRVDRAQRPGQLEIVEVDDVDELVQRCF